MRYLDAARVQSAKVSGLADEIVELSQAQPGAMPPPAWSSGF